MTKKTLFIGFVFLFLALIIFFISKDKQSTTSTALLEVPQKEAVLTLSPNPLELTEQSGSINVNLATGRHHVKFVQILLTYDPKQLADIQITQGPLLKTADILNNFVNKEKGTITYILNIPKNEKGIQGTGTIATISFTSRLKPNKSTSIYFAPDTLITDDENPTSILQKTTNTQIIQKKKQLN